MRVLAIAALLLLICDSTFAAEKSSYVLDRAASVDRAIGLLGKLAQFAREHDSHYPEAATQAAIKDLLKPIESVQDLSTFARLAAAVNGGLAEHQNHDSIFDYAQWVCVERIAEIPGENAHIELEHVLRPILGADGHSSELFSELVEKQRRLWKPDKK